MDPKLDPDKDGINQPWEEEAMIRVNPYFELDEEEDWLQNRGIHNVVNIVRITPYPENVTNPEYVLFIYVMVWSKDYGRYDGLEAHNGDREKVIMAWKIIDSKNLELKWVYTSAHGQESTGHSGVWAARGESTNVGKIWPAGDDEMTASLEFRNDHLRLQISEDKHAIYPTAECGESVTLIAPGFGEDCGGGGIFSFDCYNAGEPGVHLMDDISEIFPYERIWSGQYDHSDKFCGGLAYSEDCPGTLGGYLQIETILKDKL